MNAFVLDDRFSRQHWFRERLVPRSHWLSSATTAEMAVKMLAMPNPDGSHGFDEIYLDHDLTDEVNVDSSREDSGAEVVRWIVENKPPIGGVVVHTMNEQAGHRMVSVLRRNGYRAGYLSFLRLIDLYPELTAENFRTIIKPPIRPRIPR